MAPITLPAEFGYVGLVVAATFFTNFWHMMRIGSLRKKYEIKYPAMTSDKHEDFMRAQRVHQNNLEQLPFFYVNLVCVCQIGSRSFRCRKYMAPARYVKLEDIVVAVHYFQLIAAASNPTIAGILGAVWVVGRIVYSLGYYSAPSKRVPGAAVSTLTLTAMAIYNIYSSLRLLKVF